MELKELAVNYLNQMGVYKPYVNAFKNRDQLTIFINGMGYYVDEHSNDEDVKNVVEDLKDLNHNGQKVYAVILNNSRDLGKMYTYLLVCDDYKDEEELQSDGGEFYCYCACKSDATYGTFDYGDCAVVNRFGGLVRVG